MTIINSCTALSHDRAHYSNIEGNPLLLKPPLDILQYIAQLTATRSSEPLDPIRYCIFFGRTCGLMHSIYHELIQDATRLSYEDEALMKMWKCISKEFTFQDGTCPKTLQQVIDWSENSDNKPHIDRITKLDAKKLSLKAFPLKIELFSNLKTLHLNDNQITNIPDAIGSLVQLEDLNLSNNKITNIPEAISLLLQLKELNLCNNQNTRISFIFNPNL